MGLIFSLFDITSAGHVSFGILQYVQCILHGLTSVLLCVPFIFADRKDVDLVVACDGFPSYCASIVVLMYYNVIVVQ